MLNSMKIVALAFTARHIQDVQDNRYEGRNGIAVSYVDSAAPNQCCVQIIDANDFTEIPEAMGGKDSIPLSDGFQPNTVAWGPANDHLTLTSWSGVRTLDLRDGSVAPFVPHTFRDQFIRILPGPHCNAKRVVAISLFGRVQIAEVALPDQGPAQLQYPAEPVVFRGSTGIPQFSRDGQRLLIVSGGLSSVLDSMRLVDVTPLCRTQAAIPKNFGEKPVPAWLADLASAVSAVDTTGEGSLLTLEAVRQKYPASKAGDPYEAVWKRFFPAEGGTDLR
jgi:hypothetical protein